MTNGHSRPSLRIAVVSAAVLCVSTAASAAAHSASLASLCVGAKPGCFASVQSAVDAARDGDTIQIGPGTFAGGITIDKSVNVRGVSAAATIIKGGGPVITIGDGVHRPTVALSRVTITGGIATSTPGGGAVIAAGGGISIPALDPPSNGTGATVSISDSVVAGNRASPASLSDSDGPPCGVACAIADGGGIDNAGTLTLTDTRVSNNVAGAAAGGTSLATTADGGGIDNHPQGTLTLRRSLVTGNRAAATQPNSRFSEGGGVLNGGSMVMEDSLVEENTSVVVTTVPSVFPIDIEQNADAGGVDVSVGATATISRSIISNNTVSDFDSEGDAQAINGGIDDDGPLVLTDSSVDHNTVTAEVPKTSGLLAVANNGGLGLSDAATLRRSRVDHNTLSAVSLTGAAVVGGAGIGNVSGRLTLEATAVTGNGGSSMGARGFVVPVPGGEEISAIGGGISNLTLGGPLPLLSLTDSVVAANTLATTDGIVPQGGGIYSKNPLDRTFIGVGLVRSIVAGNHPDQCVGC